MSDALDTYQRLKRAAESKQREADRAAGALEQTMARLRKEFGCKSLKEAKAKLQELEATHERTGKKFQKAVEELDNKWGKVLRG